MNVEIGAEAALFPEKEYISGIFVAVHSIVCYYQYQFIYLFIYLTLDRTNVTQT